VYELLDTHYGCVADSAVERIEVIAAPADVAEVLEVAAGAPLLSVRRTTNDPDGIPMEFSADLFRADRTRVVVHTPPGAGVRTSRTRGRYLELVTESP
jgi:GntR family transcriptional regulator